MQDFKTQLNDRINSQMIREKHGVSDNHLENNKKVKNLARRCYLAAPKILQNVRCRFSSSY